MTKRTTSQKALNAIRDKGIYHIPAGGLMTDLHLAAFCGTTAARTIYDELIVPDDCDGIPCLPIGGRFLMTTDAAIEHVAKHARPQKRPRRRGGINGSKKRNAPTEDDRIEADAPGVSRVRRQVDKPSQRKARATET